MTTKNQLYFLTFLLLFVVVMMWGPIVAGSQNLQGGASFPSSFSYQGQLKKDGLFVNGLHDMQFKLYDAENAGEQVGNTLLVEDVPVLEGIFSVSLDFGAAAFQGGSRWLKVSVKPSAGGDYSDLSPRQLVTPSPYTAALQERLESLEVANAALESKVAALEALLAGVTRDTIGGYDTLRFSGMNVQVLNGAGNTESSNGLGNLIVGYNELRTGAGAENIRTGSHYLIIGQQHNYVTYSGIVAGHHNTAIGEYASVTGGYWNTASGYYASVSGGHDNLADGDYASVSGGYDNTASGYYASVSGGRDNTASGWGASVSGGWNNTASQQLASVSGGHDNTASGGGSSVSGGYWNTASGGGSSVSGGYDNTASGGASSVSGGNWNTAYGHASSVSGGKDNMANGSSSSVSGGHDNLADGDYASVSGGYDNLASGFGASVSGGFENTASGLYASILGGKGITVSANFGIYPQ